MRSSKIKVGHIYYVNFEPTRRGEFPNKHLAVVLKKNSDRISFVVIPMTSKIGNATNKVDLGKLDGILPPHLSTKTSYAVLDQVRTLSASRFEELSENNIVYDSVLPVDKMRILYREIIKDILYNVEDKEKNLIIGDIFKNLPSIIE